MGSVIAAPGTNPEVNPLPQTMTAVLPTGSAPSAAHSPSSALGETASDDAAHRGAVATFDRVEYASEAPGESGRKDDDGELFVRQVHTSRKGLRQGKSCLFGRLLGIFLWREES